jgi:CHAP domain
MHSPTRPRTVIRTKGRRCRSALLALGVLIPGFGLLASGALPSGGGAAGATTSTTSAPLLEFVNDDAGGRLWNDYDQTVNAQGSTITGRPSAVLNGSAVHAFARGANGDLVEFANDGANGRTWNAYDVTQLSSGPAIASDPAAILLSPTEIAVFAESVAGDLVEYLDTGATQSWVSTNVTNASGGSDVVGDPSPLVVGAALDVFARSANGHLLEFSGTPTGGPWTSADLTTVSGGPALAGDPDAVLYGTSSVHVYGQAMSGDLTEFVNDGADGRPWNAYDLTVGAAGPAVGGRPSAVVYGKTVHVYARATGGDLTEFVNDGAGGRLWNAYDLTRAADGPAIEGDPGAIRYGASSVHVYVQATSGDLIEFVNDGAGGRLWNSYDASKEVGGITVGGDPTPVVYGSTVHVYVAGPPPPPVIQQIVSLAQAADQNNAAVVETPPGSNCNPYTAYWGRGVTAGCAPGTSAEEWCADFASWVWAAAGIDTAGLDGWAYSFVAWGQNHTGAWLAGDDNDPQPGDAVVWGDLASTYASHVGIVVGVSQGMIDVVSGNAGPAIDAAGDVDAVWDSGYFDPTTSTADGYPIIGYVAPTGWSSLIAHASVLRSLTSSKLARDIANQDGGK